MQIKFTLTKEDVINMVVENFKKNNPNHNINPNDINIMVIDENNSSLYFKRIEISIMK